MNLYRTVVFILSIAPFIGAEVVEEESPQHALLRLAKENLPEALTKPEHTRSLLTIPDPCALIENQFPEGYVVCECQIGFLAIDYVCTWQGQFCAGDTCAFPVYSGSVNLLGLTATNTICLNELTVGGTVNLGTLCVTLTVSPRSETIISCSATLLGIQCDSCGPCPGGGGIQLDCSNAADGARSVCIPFALPATTVTRLNSKKEIAGYLPDFEM